jgi:hypothetical protein
MPLACASAAASVWIEKEDAPVLCAIEEEAAQHERCEVSFGSTQVGVQSLRAPNGYRTPTQMAGVVGNRDSRETTRL